MILNKNKKNHTIILSLGFAEIQSVCTVIQKNINNEITIITSNTNAKFYKTIKKKINIIALEPIVLPQPLRIKNINLFTKIFLQCSKIKFNLKNKNIHNVYYFNDFSVPIFFGLYNFFLKKKSEIYFFNSIKYLHNKKSKKIQSKNPMHILMIKILSIILKVNIAESQYTTSSDKNISWLNATGYKMDLNYSYETFVPDNWQNIKKLFNFNIGKFQKHDLLFIDTDYFILKDIDLETSIKNLCTYFNDFHISKKILIKSHYSNKIDTNIFYKKYLKCNYTFVNDLFPVEMIYEEFENIYYINSSSIINFKFKNCISLYEKLIFSNKDTAEEFSQFIKFIQSL
tara:strand:- start:157 stop:1182 length:1026 start_codon:yes stop_codon:yes gene_type:complete